MDIRYFVISLALTALLLAAGCAAQASKVCSEGQSGERSACLDRWEERTFVGSM